MLLKERQGNTFKTVWVAALCLSFIYGFISMKDVCLAAREPPPGSCQIPVTKITNESTRLWGFLFCVARGGGGWSLSRKQE